MHIQEVEGKTGLTRANIRFYEQEGFLSPARGANNYRIYAQEDVDTLCGRCDEFALAWAPVAEELWNSRPHKKTHTEYYRDRHPEEFTNSGN